MICIARASRTDEDLKERVRDSIQQQESFTDQEALAKLLRLLRYVGGDYQKAGTFDLLKKAEADRLAGDVGGWDDPEERKENTVAGPRAA